MELTYKFNNDENKVNIEKFDYLSPAEIKVYVREGDTIYVDSGDYVYVNQLLKETSNGVKWYAAISGTVSRSDDVITIINDNTNSALVSEEAVDSIEDIKKEEIIRICESLGISYENKLIVNKLKDNSKLFIVNAMDVEPYQFNSNYLFQDNVKNLLDTINLISKRFNLDTYLLLNKYDDNNVEAVNQIIDNYPYIHFKIIKDVYPFTTNQVIARRLFKEYRYEDILFLDSISLYKIFFALKEGLPVNERYFTVVLDDPKTAYVINVKYGANVVDVLRDTFNPTLDNKDIYLNNFMRKAKCDNLKDLIITDNIRTVFIFDKTDNVVSKCIKCGKCFNICPMGINPLAKKLDSACIRCGLCNFVCPANINLISREK